MFSLEASPEAQSHPHWPLVERVLNSRSFQSSARLREFLLYVSDCALRNAPEEATEQHIGIHVFQRAPGFNSSEDSIVRTQARGLRQRLQDYFANEGANEEIIISIAKGHYLPAFEPRDSESALPAAEQGADTTPEAPEPTTADAPMESERPPQRKRRTWLVAVASLFIVIACTAGLLYYRAETTPLARFWAPFLGNKSTLVIYSNALFSGDSHNGLRYAPPPPAHTQIPADYVDDYTGIGELTGVYNLARLFDSLHAQFVLKRSLLVTWDDARQSNLVFIGSTAENPSLRDLSATQDFGISARPGYAGIVNHHPAAGELPLYERAEHPLSKDYAILALLPAPQPGKKMLVCSGLTTMGTEAAVEFATRADTVQQLLTQIRDKQGNIHPFEAVLETSIVGGVPLEAKVVTIHVH